MGNLVMLKRQHPEADTGTTPAPTLLPGTEMYVAGTTVLCWWAAAWLAALGFGTSQVAPVERGKPAAAKIIHMPLRRPDRESTRLDDRAS